MTSSKKRVINYICEELCESLDSSLSTWDGTESSLRNIVQDFIIRFNAKRNENVAAFNEQDDRRYVCEKFNEVKEGCKVIISSTLYSHMNMSCFDEIKLLFEVP